MDKPLVILKGMIQTPPFSAESRRWAGFLIRKLQMGLAVTMPDSRPMPSIGARCHELRIQDSMARVTWRIVYRLDRDAVVIVDIFAKKTQKTPVESIERCKRRLKDYDNDRRSK